MCVAVAVASGVALLQLHLVFRYVCREIPSEECVCLTALLSALLALLSEEEYLEARALSLVRALRIG